MHIVTDIDGVCLNFDRGFKDFLLRHGHWVPKDRNEVYRIYDMTVMHKSDWVGIFEEDEVQKLCSEFVRSEDFAHLTPMPGAVDAIKEFVRRGYTLHFCTAMGNQDLFAMNRRKDNLVRWFGDVFVHQMFVQYHGADKRAEIEHHMGSNPPPFIFIDDSLRMVRQVTPISHRTVLFGKQTGKHNLDSIQKYVHSDMSAWRMTQLDNWNEVLEFI